MTDIDVGALSEAINDKLDRDAGNANSQGVERVVGWGMPDYSSGTSVTFPFTAPTNGVLKVNTNGYWYGYINNSDSYHGINVISGGGGDQTSDFILPKGTVITEHAKSGTNTLTFYPMKGAE